MKIKGVVSTQAATLDHAIGRGGFPLSRISIIHGKEAGGKTTLALHACVEVQQQGGVAVFIDKEYKLDPDYAEKLGVDLSRLIVIQPKTLEGVIAAVSATIRRASEIRKKTKKKKIPFLIVIDSLNACKAWESKETETGKKRYPAEARIWSEELPGIVEELAQERVALVFISQVRKKFNVTWGSDEEMSGGQAPRFHASLIVYVARVGTEKDKDGNKIGNLIEAECKKNQISAPFKKARFVIYFARGIDYQHSLILQLEEFGVIKKRTGGYLSIKKKRGLGFQLGQGYVQAAQKLRDNPKLEAKLKEVFHKKAGW
jgi:recombination protein RecA